jgi:PmbA protein
VSPGVSTLDIADRLVARARPGEQVEAYVSTGASTSVKAYGGEVESFTQATSAGVGVRVVVDGRQGFASAGTFDDEVLG